MKKLSPESAEFFINHGVDIKNRVITSFDTYVTPGEDPEFDFTTSERLVKNLHILNSLSKNPLSVLMNTQGGNVYQMLAMYDAVRLSRSPVTIVGCGSIFSGGAMIMQAASWRVMQENCRFMAHIGSGTVDKDFLDINDLYTTTLYKKMSSHNRSYKMRDLKKMLRDSVCLSAEQALELGLIDEVL